MNANEEVDILLGNLPQWSFSQPPMGISYIAAYLRKYNYNVIQRDFSIELFHALNDSDKEIMSASEELLGLIVTMHGHEFFGAKNSQGFEQFRANLILTSTPSSQRQQTRTKTPPSA